MIMYLINITTKKTKLIYTNLAFMWRRRGDSLIKQARALVFRQSRELVKAVRIRQEGLSSPTVLYLFTKKIIHFWIISGAEGGT